MSGPPGGRAGRARAWRQGLPWLARLCGVLPLALALLLGLPRSGQAHPMPLSQAWVDTLPQGLRLSLRLPLEPLAQAAGLAPASLTTLPAGAALPTASARALSAYLLAHVGARSDGLGWQVAPPTLRLVDGNKGTAGIGWTHGDGGEDGEGSAHLQATATALWAELLLTAPPGADPRRPTLLLDVVVHQVANHRLQVLLRQDWAGGRAAQPPRPLGVLDLQQTRLPLVLDDMAGPWAAVGALVRDGMRHLAEGADHLLFIALLALAAPWRAGPAPGGAALHGPGATLRRVLALATAFTAGHSLSLAAGSLGGLQVPSGPVELGVALTLLAAAAHAWQPRLLRGEALLTGLLGLVHGLAFSASLLGAGLSLGQQALALGAFNLGIELAQVLVLAALLPPLLWLCRHPRAYQRVRRGGAALGGLMALAWALQRGAGALG
ncbi:HupE/UreJ family protein [Ideonella livida]|uniref:HupE/UreJ family protein n=1 Tax=Ideonella livida TaxID=2707176 RepID=A0A7C9PF82_9BURK|nr:HupE/UreJ family protein [Ideonella livida]NDY90393.1 HupE/UreJ family protein [Ideonella livida]